MNEDTFEAFWQNVTDGVSLGDTMSVRSAMIIAEGAWKTARLVERKRILESLKGWTEKRP